MKGDKIILNKGTIYLWIPKSIILPRRHEAKAELKEKYI